MKFNKFFNKEKQSSTLPIIDLPAKIMNAKLNNADHVRLLHIIQDIPVNNFKNSKKQSNLE